ncbi:MAG TPA: DNA adenine methylase, partial [Abditibacteriaceae bacterium]
MTSSIQAPTLKWPGSKWRIAEWIVGHFPAHDCYLEPFFGSGATFFLKPPASCEIINDRDGEVVNFFSVVRDYPEQLATALTLTPWARAEYDFCRKKLGKPRGHSLKARVERARRLAVTMWMTIGQRRSSVDGAGGCGWRSRLLADQSPVPTWQRLPDRVRLAAARLLNAQIENRAALDVIARHADKDVLIYADPPYHHDTRQRQIYAHEMNDADHAQLLDALEAHPGPVILSGYHCAL